MIFDLKYNKKNAILKFYSIFLIWTVFKNFDFKFYLNDRFRISFKYLYCNWIIIFDLKWNLKNWFGILFKNSNKIWWKKNQNRNCI